MGLCIGMELRFIQLVDHKGNKISIILLIKKCLGINISWLRLIRFNG
jgi:hypothetical protein